MRQPLAPAAVGSDRPHEDLLVKKRLLSDGLKSGLGIAVLAIVIWREWNPSLEMTRNSLSACATIALQTQPINAAAYASYSLTVPPRGSPGLGHVLTQPLQTLPILLATASLVIGVLITFVRWYVLVRAQELPFTLYNALRLGLIGFFFNNLFPGGIGGDFIKAAFLVREQSRRTVAVATVLLDRAMGLWGIIWLVALLGGVYWMIGDPLLLKEAYLRSIVFTALLIIGGTLLLCGILVVLPAWRAERFAGRLSRIPKVGQMASEFWRAIWMYRLKRTQVAGALLLSLLSQFFLVSGIYCAAHVFRDSGQSATIPSLRESFLIVPVGIAVEALFPTPGGVGGAEAAYSELFALVDNSMRATGLLASLAKRLICLGLGLVGYLVYLGMRPALPVVQLDDGPAPRAPPDQETMKIRIGSTSPQPDQTLSTSRG
jgi:uncharacterized protein (TIRG00374 family)